MNSSSVSLFLSHNKTFYVKLVRFCRGRGGGLRGFGNSSYPNMTIMVLTMFLLVLLILVFVFRKIAKCDAERARAKQRLSDWRYDVIVAKTAILHAAKCYETQDYYVRMEKANSLLDNNDRAQERKIQSSSSSSSSSTEAPVMLFADQPTSGSYRGLHQEGQYRCYSWTDIKFQPTKRGQTMFWKMTGTGSNTKGDFEITEGWVVPSGKAYWLERQGSRQILHMGSFDFADGTYQGRWHTNRGKSYEDFTMKYENDKSAFSESLVAPIPRKSGYASRYDKKKPPSSAPRRSSSVPRPSAYGSRLVRKTAG